jgi:hypothetical protein
MPARERQSNDATVLRAFAKRASRSLELFGDSSIVEAFPQMMIGNHMPRTGQGPRVLLNTCAYAVACLAVIGGSFAAALAVWPEQNGPKTATQMAAKIGPGYGRMRTIDFGKPEKPVYSGQATGAYSSLNVIAAKRASTQAALPVLSNVAFTVALNPLVVAVAQAPYIAPDIHRVY